MRLGTGGSAIIPPGELSADLESVLAGKAAQLAEQFLAIIIRAIDYCPPVDLRYGEFLRALITADCDLTPEDKYGYREALIDAFLRRNIYPRHVNSLSEDALLWRATNKRLDPSSIWISRTCALACIPDSGGPQRNCAGGRLPSANLPRKPDRLSQFGLVDQHDPRLRGCTVGLPRVESIRSARRVGPDGQIVFDVVAEIVQRCVVNKAGKQIGFEVYGVRR